MVDEGSVKTDEIRTRFLDHHRSDTQSFPIDLENTFHSAKCGPYTKYYTRGRIGPGYTIRGNPWILDSAHIEQCLFDAFRYFESGCADKETLLANFAWELPSVRDLWPSFRDLFVAKGGKHQLRSWRDIKRNIKTDSSAYLAYQFGVLPLIGDLIHVYNRLTTLSDHIAWLRKNSGQLTKVEYKAGLPLPTASILPSRPSSAPTGAGGYWRSVPELRAGFKAWATITYDVSALTDLELSIKTLKRAFGLNNPAAIIWEAIPYSFVVDWISNVGDLVGRLESPIKLPCTIEDCGYGVWVESTIEDYYTTWGKTSMIRRTRTRGYSRRLGLPIGISKLSLDTPSAKQLVLGLALIGQKI